MEFVKDFEEFENQEECIKAILRTLNEMIRVQNELAERIADLEK